MFVCFLCLFGVYCLTRNIFHPYGDVNIIGEGLQILTYAKHSLPLSSEGSWACHNYCDTGHPFIMVIPEYPWQSRLLPRVYQWSCHFLFLRLRSVRGGIRKPYLSACGSTLRPTAPTGRSHEMLITNLHVLK